LATKFWLLIDKNMKIVLFLIGVITLTSCHKNPQLGNPPSDQDASFTFAASDTNSNVIVFSAVNQDILCMWDFGNGIKKQGNTVVASYPYAGTYTVKLTVFNKGGSKSSTQQLVIAQDDLSLLNNPYYTKLTGGASGPGYKVWHVDSSYAGHFGVGPDPESALGPVPEWYSAGANEKPGCGMYDDRYIFYLNGFKFDMVNHGDVYVHNSLAAQFPGSFQNLGDFTAPYTDQLQGSWLLTEGDQTSISLSTNSFLGFYTGVNEYRILDITDSTMSLQYKHHAGGLSWYLKLSAE
jgi:PKD repeat protein